MKKSFYISLQVFIIIASLFAFFQYTVVNFSFSTKLSTISKKISQVDKEPENTLAKRLKEWERQSQLSASADDKVSVAPSPEQVQQFKDFYLQRYGVKEDANWENWLQMSSNIVGTIFPVLGFMLSCWLWIQQRKEKKSK